MIIGINAKVEVNGALLRIGDAFLSALPSAEVAK